MLCGRCGAPDSMGRATLFFHALVAAKSTMSDAKADAFSLFSQGVFADKMTKGEIDALTVEVQLAAHKPQLGQFVDATIPFVIRSDRPMPDLVRATVGDKSLDESWTTFAFQAMANVDVQVLPPRVLCPPTVNEYDGSGTLTRSAAVGNCPNRDNMPLEGANDKSCVPCGQAGASAPKEKSCVMPKLSLFLNVVLAVVCVGIIFSRKTYPDENCGLVAQDVVTNIVEKIVEKKVVAPLSEVQKTEIEDAAISRFKAVLREKFPGENRILDYEASVAKLPMYEKICSEAKFEVQKTFLSKLRQYVSFVNTEILEDKTP